MNRSIFKNFVLCIRVFAAHYRKAPLQAGAIIVGIVLAVTLLTGVRAINENAIRSYSQSTEQLSQQASWLITPATGNKYLDESIYFDVKSAGISQSLAVIEGTIIGDGGLRWKIQGSDIISALTAFSKENGQERQSAIFDDQLPVAEMLAGKPVVLMSNSQAERLDIRTELQLAGRTLQVVSLDNSFNIDSRILMDISLAQELLTSEKQISYIALFGSLDKEQLRLEKIIGDRALLSQSDKGEGLTALTDSFHLNLTAMSLLAFVVGLFIAYNGIRYSLLKRHRLFTQLQQLGMEKKAILSAICAELLLLVIVGSVIGFVLGLQLSHWLHPMVSVTLEQLYDANILPGTWHWRWLFQAIALTLLSSLLACSTLFIQLIRQPLARTAGQSHQQINANRMHRVQLAIALIFLAVSSVFMFFSNNYQHTMLLLGLVVISIPLALPWCLAKLVHLMSKVSSKGLLGYQLAETKELVSPMSLAMMAMLLAVTANISMNTLVGSFEVTLKQWLNARLHADLYIRPAQSEILNVEKFLLKQPEVSAVYKQYYQKSQFMNQPILLVTKDPETFRQTTIFKQAETDIWSHFFASDTLIINEPMAVRLGLNIGDNIKLDTISNRSFRIGGVFYDYGNPYGEILVPPDAWMRSGLPDVPLSLGIGVIGDIDIVRRLIIDKLGVSDALIFDQSQIKSRAVTIFTRTFAITKVLNTLTLFVAAIGLFSACYMLTQARVAPIARLYSLGVSQNQLVVMVMTQMLSIVLLTCLVALPSGAILGYLLINKVTLQAFGWSFAMVWDWGSYFEIVLLALFASLLAVALPLYRQTRRPLLSSLQSEVI